MALSRHRRRLLTAALTAFLVGLPAGGAAAATPHGLLDVATNVVGQVTAPVTSTAATVVGASDHALPATEAAVPVVAQELGAKITATTDAATGAVERVSAPAAGAAEHPGRLVAQVAHAVEPAGTVKKLAASAGATVERLARGGRTTPDTDADAAAPSPLTSTGAAPGHAPAPAAAPLGAGALAAGPAVAGPRQQIAPGPAIARGAVVVASLRDAPTAVLTAPPVQLPTAAAPTHRPPTSAPQRGSSGEWPPSWAPSPGDVQVPSLSVPGAGTALALILVALVSALLLGAWRRLWPGIERVPSLRPLLLLERPG